MSILHDNESANQRLSCLVLGTHNEKKRREMAILLEPHGIQLKSLTDFAQPIEVDETGQTFAENAALKASEQAQHLDHWVLGEDSGIVVDALDGQPGVYSARFSGPDATDSSNNALLLERLRGIPASRRSAHYVCHMSLADPSGRIRIDCEGTCHGTIRTTPAGSAGFGYDPLFQLREYHRTFGQLGDTVKSVLSHRARAMRQLLRLLARRPKMDFKARTES